MAGFDKELDVALSGDEPVSDDDEFGINVSCVECGHKPLNLRCDVCGLIGCEKCMAKRRPYWGKNMCWYCDKWSLPTQPHND